LMRAVPGFTPPRNSPLFCLQDLEVLRTEMEQAGFRDIQVKPFESWLEVESGDHLWETIVAGAPAVAGMMRNVPEERQRAVRSALVEIIRSRSEGGGPVRLPIGFNIGVGTK
jgi:hypothetical protein